MAGSFLTDLVPGKAFGGFWRPNAKRQAARAIRACEIIRVFKAIRAWRASDRGPPKAARSAVSAAQATIWALAFSALEDGRRFGLSGGLCHFGYMASTWAARFPKFGPLSNGDSPLQSFKANGDGRVKTTAIS
jgi:hypothetical protein